MRWKTIGFEYQCNVHFLTNCSIFLPFLWRKICKCSTWIKGKMWLSFCFVVILFGKVNVVVYCDIQVSCYAVFPKTKLLCTDKLNSSVPFALSLINEHPVHICPLRPFAVGNQQIHIDTIMCRNITIMSL